MGHDNEHTRRNPDAPRLLFMELQAAQVQPGTAISQPPAKRARQPAGICAEKGSASRAPGCPLSLPAIPDEHRMRPHRFDHPAVRVEVRGLDEVRRRIEPALQVCPVSRLLQRGPEQKVEHADEL
jgi:hypothetical protein